MSGPKPDKPKPPPPPPNTPSMADQSVFQAGQAEDGYTSLVSTTPTGLLRKAFTSKRSLIGG